MATRAERFKATEQRSDPKRKKAPAATKRKPPTKSVLDKKDPQEVSDKAPVGKRRVTGAEHTAERNVSKRASKKASVALEDSATGTPPRKSTRSSANRAKPDSQLQRRETRATSSPSARATRDKVKAKKVR